MEDEISKTKKLLIRKHKKCAIANISFSKTYKKLTEQCESVLCELLKKEGFETHIDCGFYENHCVQQDSEVQINWSMKNNALFVCPNGGNYDLFLSVIDKIAQEFFERTSFRLQVKIRHENYRDDYDVLRPKLPSPSAQT